MSLCSSAWGFPSLSYDTVTAGTISAAAQVNTYTFSANANDILDFTVVTTSSTSGTLWPCIEVYSGGVPVTNGTSCPGGTNVGLNGLAIPSAGTYTITVKDYNNTNTGNYDIFLQRTDGPVGAVTLPLDQVQTGNIASATQANAYTFSANANDVFNFTVVTTSSTTGTLWPCIQVYNSAGTPVTNGGSCPGGTNVVLNGLTIASAGTYSVIVKDYSNTNTGNYSIFLQRTDGPPNAITLSYDTVTAGTISAATQTNNYTFAANANDILNFTVVTTSSTSGTLWPCIQVYNSAGAPVTNGGSCPGGTDVELNGLVTPSAGTYSVILKDFSNANAGNYNIFLQRTNDPANPINVDFDQTMTGTISAVAQSNVYTFDGTANDTLNFTVVATSGTLWPCIQVYNSAGAPVSGGASCPGGGTATLDGFVVPSTGTYSVFLKDFGDTRLGNYNISVQCSGTCLLPAPTLTSISPTNVIAGSGGLTLTVTGADFVNNESNSVVQWNGNPLTTTWVSLTQMTAAPAADTATAGIFPVTVFTPAPGGGTSGSMSFTVNNPVPVLTSTSLSPASATAGGATFTLTLTGSGFVNGSSVQWNTYSLATTYVSATQLSAQVPATDIATAGTASVTVFNTTPGGGTSTAQTFTINNPVPVLSSLSPNNARAGGAGFTLTLNGSNFVAGSVVNWNTNSLVTTYVSATQLTAQVPATDIATAGTASVTVFNATPGGGTSSAQTFSIDNPATMTGPTPGGTLTGASTTFTWSAGSAGTTGYGLNVGTSLGGADLVNIGPLSGTSTTVTLPTSGAKIYVRLWTIFNGTTYLFNDYTYTEFTQIASAITSPAPGSTLTSASTTFTWNAGPAGTTGYGLNVGTSLGGANLVNIGPLSGTSVTVSLPTNGTTIYVRLWTILNSTTYFYNDYSYTEFTQSASAITSPTPGGTLTSASTTFTWNAGPAGTTGYGLNVGTSLGGANLVNIYPLSGTSVTVNLPTNGTTIYVRLWTVINGTTFLSNDYTYTEFSQSASAITSPAPGSTLTSASTTFTWNAGPAGTTGYGLNVGTSPGGANLVNIGPLSGTSVTVNLPTNGTTIYVRLWTILNGSTYLYNDYTYTEAP
ncbi:MAG: IPT/TIG domain-containing protein [Terracidiphilus sp.]